ncbi:MAG: TRAP transporter fused permease subunit [Deltaproteobacteria bacterium]|nr:TRAP transporter fused permease subunit [Deltaproteobacteria bacterium]
MPHFRKRILHILSILFPLYVVVIVTLRPISLYPERASVFIFALVLTFLSYPLYSERPLLAKIYSFIDLVLIAGVIVSGMHLVVSWRYIVDHMGAPRTIDIAMGVVAILITLEAVRRTILLILPVILLVLAYAVWGSHLGGIMAAAPVDYERLISGIYLTFQGLFGIVLDVFIKYIIPLMVMGALLKAIGAMDVPGDLVNLAVGRTAGGPAKLAIVTSGLFGMMSGSAVANIGFTGTFTIPIMKKYGYQSDFSAAVEACASNGGQIMPPVMGASAFIMADFIGVSYARIMLAGFIPAFLFYITVFLRVHFRAKQRGLQRPSEDVIGKIKGIREIGPRLIPLVIIFTTLMVGLFMWSPTRAAVVTTFVIFPLSFFRRETRLTLGKILDALKDAAEAVVPVAATMVAMGMIVGVSGLSGLGIKFSELMLIASGQSLTLLLLVTMVACIIFGMGLASSAVYIFVAVMLAPALIKLGLPVLVAHFFIFYFAQLSCIIPPVCLCAYAAGSIARAEPMKTAFWAVSLGIMGFIVPFLFVFEPSLLLEGSFTSTMISFSLAFAGLFGLVFSLGGYLNRQLGPLQRTLFLVAAGIIFYRSGITLDLLGIFLLGALILINIIRKPAMTRV